MGRSFGTGTTGAARFDLTKLVSMREDVHERLAGVIIERLPYDRLIPRYDRPHMLFHLDPPCSGCTDDYGRDIFSEADFERLSGLLRTIQGRFILSINDVPQIRDLFAWATMEPIELKYRISGKVTAARELFISFPSGSLNMCVCDTSGIGNGRRFGRLCRPSASHCRSFLRYLPKRHRNEGRLDDLAAFRNVAPPWFVGSLQ